MKQAEPVWINYMLTFDGRDALQHRLEAHPAGQSIEGFSWALALTLNYGVTGRTRYSRDTSRSAKIFISPPQKGSVFYGLDVLVQENPFLTAVVGGYAVNTVTPYINNLIKYVFGQAMGLGTEIAETYLKVLNREGLDTTIQRVEPPLTRAHTAVNRTAEEITFTSKGVQLIRLNEETKENLKAIPVGVYDTLDTNVTSFNLLTGNGRLYSPELAATVPFTVNKNYRHGTTTALIMSMEQYSLGRMGTIRIVGERVETPSGRLMKYFVGSAEEISPVEWVDGVDPLRQLRP